MSSRTKLVFMSMAIGFMLTLGWGLCPGFIDTLFEWVILGILYTAICLYAAGKIYNSIVHMLNIKDPLIQRALIVGILNGFLTGILCYLVSVPVGAMAGLAFCVIVNVGIFLYDRKKHKEDKRNKLP